jgi:hypothetical protein
MDRYRIHDTNSSSKAEETRRHTDNVIRRRATSSRRDDAGSSNRPIERTRLDNIEEARAQAIDRGNAKMQKYQQEAERYQEKDKDTFKLFEKSFNTYLPNREKKVIKTTTISSKIGRYINEINVEDGIIIGKTNDHYNKRKEKREFHYSEIVFNQLRLVLELLDKKISEFDLKSWYGENIHNTSTLDVVKLFFPEERSPNGKIKKGKKTFLAGTDGFIALAGTEAAQSKFYLLAQHPKAFPGKEVTSITVIRHSDEQIDIEYDFGL